MEFEMYLDGPCGMVTEWLFLPRNARKPEKKVSAGPDLSTQAGRSQGRSYEEEI